MNIVKELDQIALPISESEYREMPELSYSTLSTYERTGFDGLSHLFDKIESPALTLGSIVDTIITGTQKEFDDNYFVTDFPSLGEKETQVANMLYEAYGNEYISMSLIPFQAILDAANTVDFYKNWKEETRVKALTERCSYYYGLKAKAGTRTIVDRKTYDDAIAMVTALKESPATKGYFADNDELSPIRRYYQLKFRAGLGQDYNMSTVFYRCMADLIVVDYESKKIYPIDLKTSGKSEWHFEDSFKQWNYMIQSRLYYRIIEANLANDPYFKDFSLENYRFIVVNKATLTPLVWEFPLTKEYGTLVDDKGNEFRDPFDIGVELQSYLDFKPQVPKGISVDGLNTIQCLKLKENINK